MEWISVEERLPAPSKHWIGCSDRVLIRQRDDYITIAAYYHSSGRWESDSGFGISAPSHWGPLPEPPEDDDGMD